MAHDSDNLLKFPTALATVIGEHDNDEERIYLVVSPCHGELEGKSVGIGMGTKDHFIWQEQMGITINKTQAKTLAMALNAWAES